MSDSPPPSQPTPTTPDAGEVDLTPKSFGRAMPPWEIHFRFWLWTSFTVGGCYVLYAYQTAIKETAHSQPFLQNPVHDYMMPLWILFIVTSNFATQPEGELKKPVKWSHYIYIFGSVLAIGGMVFMWCVIAPDSAVQLSWSILQWEAFAQSIFLNPLCIIFVAVFFLHAHRRKYRRRLKVIAQPLRPVAG